MVKAEPIKKLPEQLFRQSDKNNLMGGLFKLFATPSQHRL